MIWDQEESCEWLFYNLHVQHKDLSDKVVTYVTINYRSCLHKCFFFFLVWTKKFRYEKTDLWYAEEVSFHPLTQEILLWAVKCKQALILHLMVVLGHLLPWQALSTTSQCFPSQHQKKLSHADRGGNNVCPCLVQGYLSTGDRFLLNSDFSGPQVSSSPPTSQCLSPPSCQRQLCSLRTTTAPSGRAVGRGAWQVALVRAVSNFGA